MYGCVCVRPSPYDTAKESKKRNYEERARLWTTVELEKRGREKAWCVCAHSGTVIHARPALALNRCNKGCVQRPKSNRTGAARGGGGGLDWQSGSPDASSSPSLQVGLGNWQFERDRIIARRGSGSGRSQFVVGLLLLMSVVRAGKHRGDAPPLVKASVRV